MINGSVEHGDVYLDRKLGPYVIYKAEGPQGNFLRLWNVVAGAVLSSHVTSLEAEEDIYLGNISQELKGFFEALEKMK